MMMDEADEVWEICTNCSEAHQLQPFLVGFALLGVGATVAIKLKRRGGWLLCAIAIVILFRAAW